MHRLVQTPDDVTRKASFPTPRQFVREARESHDLEILRDGEPVGRSVLEGLGLIVREESGV